MTNHLPRRLGELGLVTLLLIVSLSSSSTATFARAATTTGHPGRGPGGTFHTTIRGVTPPLQLITQKCDDAQHCLYYFFNGTSSTNGGDWTGTTISGTAATIVSGSYVASDVEIFTGTVKPCGTGTVVVTLLGQPARINAKGSALWRIAAGLGSGDLAAMTGEGTAHFSPNPDGTTTTVGTGRIRCHK